MPVFICDPGLFSKGSHHFNWNVEVATEFARQGHHPKIYGFQSAPPEVLRDACAIGHFEDLMYNKHCGERPFDEERNWLGLNASFRRDLERLDSEIAQPDSIVIIPAITQHQIEGVAQWFAGLPEQRKPKLAISLMFFPQWTPWGDRAIRGAEYYARAIERLKPWIGRSVLFYAENREIKNCFEELTGAPIEVMPIPWSRPVRHFTSRRRDRVRFGYFGHSRNEKGFHLLPEALDLCLAARLDFDAVVQIQHNQYEAGTIAADELLRSKPNVRSIIGPLEREHYYEVLDSCDVILIPYDPTMYRTRGSGLLCEAIIYDKPIITTVGTAMAQAAARGECAAGLCEFNSVDLARAMVDSSRQRSELEANARRIGPAWYAENNVAVFCRRIMEFAGVRAHMPDRREEPHAGNGNTSVAVPVPPFPKWSIDGLSSLSFSGEAAAHSDIMPAPSSAVLRGANIRVGLIPIKVEGGGALLLDLGPDVQDGSNFPVVSVKINGHLLANIAMGPERQTYRFDGPFPWLAEDLLAVLTLDVVDAPEGCVSVPTFYGMGFRPASRWTSVVAAVKRKQSGVVRPSLFRRIPSQGRLQLQRPESDRAS